MRSRLGRATPIPGIAPTTSDGLQFLEVGVQLGYWSKKTADGVAESVRQGYGLSKVRRRLLR